MGEQQILREGRTVLWYYKCIGKAVIARIMAAESKTIFWQLPKVPRIGEGLTFGFFYGMPQNKAGRLVK